MTKIIRGVGQCVMAQEPNGSRNSQLTPAVNSLPANDFTSKYAILFHPLAYEAASSLDDMRTLAFTVR